VLEALLSVQALEEEGYHVFPSPTYIYV